jgi:hypothetical protein
MPAIRKHTRRKVKVEERTYHRVQPTLYARAHARLKSRLLQK